MVVIIAVFRKVILAANKCTLPGPAPDQTSLSLIAMESTILSKKHENQTVEFASHLEFAPRQHPGKIPLLPFGLSSRLYQSMTVCNFYPGYLKVHYLTACLILHQHHVKKEN
jgi:hypothetical protein